MCPFGGQFLVSFIGIWGIGIQNHFHFNHQSDLLLHVDFDYTKDDVEDVLFFGQVIKSSSFFSLSPLSQYTLGILTTKNQFHYSDAVKLALCGPHNYYGPRKTGLFLKSLEMEVCIATHSWDLNKCMVFEQKYSL